MTPTETDQGPLEQRLRRAIELRDVEAFGELVAADARWGDDDHPNRCRSRADVVGTLSRGLAGGGSAEIVELVTGSKGILCTLKVRWPGQEPQPRLHHVYRVVDGRIAEIQRFNDRRAAAEAAGLDF